MSIKKVSLKIKEVACNGSPIKFSASDEFVTEATFFVKGSGSETATVGVGSDKDLWASSWNISVTNTRQIIPPDQSHYNLSDFYVDGAAGVTVVCIYGVIEFGG